MLCSNMVDAAEYQGRVVFAPRARVALHLLTFPNAAAAAQIAALASRFSREYDLRAKPLQTSRFHVSLQNFGEYDELEMSESIATKVRSAMANVMVHPFAVMFNRVESFSGRDGHYPLVLRGDDGVVGLEILYRSLGTAMRIAGLKSRLVFTPHLTLLYGERPISERLIEPVGWTVREFALVLSLIGKTKYISLDRWTLGA